MEYVYIIQNSVTGRAYVGRSYDPDHRYHQHIVALRSGRHPNELMQEDYNKCGENAFSWQILDKTPNITRSGLEGKYMIKYRTYDKRYGYNYKDPFCARGDKFTKPIREAIGN